MKELLQFQSVKKMLGELKLLTRSENTERTYLKGIKRFVEYFKVKNLDDFLREVRKQGNGEEIYRDFVLYLASLELAPKTIASWSSAVKKLLKTNEIEIKRDVKIRVYNVHEDVLPSKEILRKIIENSNLRAKAIILFLLSSGLRVGELINLKIKDVNLSEFPPSIRVRGLTAKERKSRITFISKEASIFLKKYLEKRSKKEKLNEESFLFVTKDGKKMSYQNLHYI
ncbi:MAG: tyrosine-type recombinase/integrase, partial [Candidatus Aenigmarchaeota archaeon]|nr:tyrosine-type recombinase/integrase [Candidatus Aenigmarchaeota archaeon]